ncbi:MAG TPA: DEAD/DEAH box helicase, partial [Firmicutes bacterium]|nr:DEAD/DEAH box helicase [Bacillota bacterium]
MRLRERAIAIRKELRFAWVPFFGRFGRLTPVQVETIPKVLQGHNVIVASPTATGKTEAIVAPVAERLSRRGCDSLGVVYVVPTRALANDTYVRIEGPLRDMGFTTGIKHGDKPRIPTREPPNILITTPESLDSLICRRPQMFSVLQVVILDEIHLIDNTYRGDQLRVLLRRLRRLVADGSFATHLLSATLSSPGEVGRRYAEDATIVEVHGRREIDYYLLNSLDDV